MMDEDQTGRLFKYLIGVLEDEAHLTPEKKAELATQAMKQAWMQPHSGPSGAEKFVRAYEKAYLLELRAGLVVTNQIVMAQRLFTYKEKLAPEVQAYLKGLPDIEQPTSLVEMNRAVRKWATIQRIAQGGSGGRKQEHMHEIEEQETNKGKRAKAKAEKEKLDAEASNDLTEIVAKKTAEHLLASLNKGKGKGHPAPPDKKDWSKEVCFTCGGKHLVQLRGKARCPNTVAEELGTAETNKANNMKCTFGVDKDKTQCGGSHSFEDHKEALARFRKPTDK